MTNDTKHTFMRNPSAEMTHERILKTRNLIIQDDSLSY